MSGSVDVPPLDLANRVALRPAEAARALGVSERKLRELLPRLPHVRLDGIVVLPVDQLRRWLAEQTEIHRSRTDQAVAEILADVYK
jgi:hypothetical protein